MTELTEATRSRLAPGVIRRDGLVAIIAPDVLDIARGCLDGYDTKVELDRLIILVPPADPPSHSARMDGEVVSFIASGPWTVDLEGPSLGAGSWCYQTLSKALAGNPGAALPIITIEGAGRPPKATAIERSVEAIVPHRGEASLLSTCLASLLQQSLPCKIALGFDQTPDRSEAAMVASSARISASVVVNPPHGPYVIRQHLALGSTADFLAFQDSDDVSVPARLAELTAAAILDGAEIVGCHELRLDDIQRAVFAIRFPLDVNAALTVTAGHPQLFPTTLVRTDYFKRLGGFSTDMRFGADTEFLLRSHFSARIRNVDRFLYVRRRRAGSLTTAPETALGTPRRVELDKQWKSDFAAIKDGVLNLGDSSLALRPNDRPASFIAL